MASLLETLQQSHPSIASEAAAEFRTALVAILQQLEQDETAADRSLQGWWTWLDEEGYDRDGFGLILNQVGEAKLGQQGQAELLSLLQANAAEPGGLPELIDHVQSEHPALAKEIESLETLAATEEQQLHARAGGISAGGIVGIAGGLAVGTLATVLLYKKGKSMANWVSNKWKNRGQGAEAQIEENIQRDETRLSEKTAREARQAEANAVEIASQNRDIAIREAGNIEKNGYSPRQIKEFARLKAGVIRDEIHDNEKNIVEYIGKDCKERGAKLAYEHMEKYGEKMIDDDIKGLIRSTPEYQGKLKVMLEDQEDLITKFRSKEWIETNVKLGNYWTDYKDKAENEIESGMNDSFFSDARKKLWSENGFDYIEEHMNKLTTHYTKQVEAEVALTRKTADKEAEREAKNIESNQLNTFTEGKAAFKKSEVQMSERLYKKAQKAEEDALREANAAKREAWEDMV